jgi:FixJ family two-component response regulator
MRIAVVDDDQSVRKALARLLVTAEFEPSTFGSAREFLHSLKTNSFNCIILDLQMPEINGLDLQGHLRATGIDIPLIFMTAYPEPGTRERCEASGASAFLLKPMSSAVLVNAINSAIGAALRQNL